MAESNPVQFSIKEIKELEFFVDESNEIGEKIDFHYSVDILPDANKELLKITITANYIDKSSKNVFLKGKVATSFSLPEIKSYLKKNVNDKEELNLPEQAYILFFGIAFTHARAVLARCGAGTRFADLLMPVINPEREFRRLFGEKNCFITS